MAKTWTPIDPYPAPGTDGGGLTEGDALGSPPRVLRGLRGRAAGHRALPDARPALGHSAALVMALLAKVNRTRTARTLSVGEVVGLVRGVRGRPAGLAVVWEWAEGAHGRGWNWHDSRTTLALAARVDGVVSLGIAECSAWKATPGRCWYNLGGWGRGKTAADVARKAEENVRTWAEALGPNGLITIG